MLLVRLKVIDIIKDVEIVLVLDVYVHIELKSLEPQVYLNFVVFSRANADCGVKDFVLQLLWKVARVKLFPIDSENNFASFENISYSKHESLNEVKVAWLVNREALLLTTIIIEVDLAITWYPNRFFRLPNFLGAWEIFSW